MNAVACRCLDVSVLRVFRHHCRERELPAHDRPRIEIVLASTLAQFVEWYAAFGVARKDERLARAEQRPKSDDV